MKQLLIIILLSVSVNLLAQQGDGRYTFVFLNTNPDRADLPKEQVDSLQTGHIANINRLVKARKMIAAGPFYGGGGIFIFDTDVWGTKSLLDTDPAISAGRFKLEVIPFNMDMGNICTLWDVPEESIAMTTYFIMRFTNKSETTDARAAQTNLFTLKRLREAQEKFPELTVHADMKFADNAGQVVIFEGPEDQIETYASFFEYHELVERDMMDFYLRKLYFPEGVFCEK